jgi:2-polyprenyl-3-methyl-5-hydroxy-6-metoxy-1,4-benzoquinol methylase
MIANIPNSYDYDLSIPVGYYDEIHEKRCGIQSKWHHLKFKHVAKHIPHYASVLDIGCGSGTFIGNYLQANPALGIDISQNQISYANQKYGSKEHQFITGYPANIQLEDGSFDVITIIELVEHIDRGQAIDLFKRAYNLLKPGGRLIITTPNYFSFWPLLQLIVSRVSAISYGHQHINRYTLKKLKKDISSTGFVDLSMGTFLFAAPYFASLNWNLSDCIDRIEQGIHCLGLGSLVFCVACKGPA